MSNVGYDLDTSGGLMPLIRALIKPPDEDANGQKNKKPQHPYYKRPGKGHNHDSCDACGEGGDLICCDRCPASFHLGCYDPPLEESDIPAGQWLCKECEAAQVDKPASSRSSRAHSPVDSKSDTEKKTRTLRNNRTNSLAKKRSRDDIKEEEEEKNVQEEKPLTPMEVLVKAAKIMNPKQFELPRDMRVPCPFPGTEKEGGNGGVVSVDAWGCVPPPARLCFACGATCKHAPLLQCDYCPLLFHQDCLDPPLTALPTGRWMCPNHVEQYIDYKLVNSISATERVALWDKFSGPVDQHAIRIDFIRRARNRHPPFRVKVPVGVKGRVVVPAMVRYHYQNPPPLMPSRREYVRCRNVLRNQKYSEDPDASTEDEDLDVPPESKHKICMNISCPQYTGEGRCEHSSTTLKGASASDAAEDLDAINRSQVEGGSESSELSDSDFEYLASPVKRRRVSSDEGTADARRGGGRGTRAARGCLPLRVDGDAEGLLAAVDRQLRKLDDRLVKLLAWQRLQQVLSGEQCWGSFRGAPLSAAAAAAVRRSVDRARLARHGYRHVPLPSELLSAGDRARIAAAVWGAPPPPRRARAASPGHSLSAAAVRATLCPVQSPASHGLGDGLGRPIPMRLSRLIVGSDSSCDVVLDPGRCRYVSPHHATIFMDEVTRHFELINYSEWGSRVNGVLYACEVSRPAHAPVDADAAEDRARLVREIVAARMPKPVRVNGALSCGSAPAHACRCAPAPAPPAAAAWEGSALVPHGALLQFGCLMYVFSILDAPGFPYESSVETPAL